MMWFEVVKIEKPKYPREYKKYQGNRPHFYQFLKRAFRPASAQTPQYLQKYRGWDEVDDSIKAGIKRLFEKHHPKNHPEWPEKRQRWGSNNPIGGIKVDWEGLYPTLDEDYYNEWRNSKKGEHSRLSGYNYQQGHLYRVISQLLLRTGNEWAQQMYIN